MTTRLSVPKAGLPEPGDAGRVESVHDEGSASAGMRSAASSVDPCGAATVRTLGHSTVAITAVTSARRTAMPAVYRRGGGQLGPDRVDGRACESRLERAKIA